MKTNFDRRAKTLLVRKGLLTEDQAAAAAAAAVAQRKPFVETMIEMGFIDEPTFISCIALEMNIPPIDLERLKLRAGTLRSISREGAESWCVLPIARIDDILTIAVHNPFDILKLDDIRMSTDCDLRPVVSAETTIRKHIAGAFDTPYLKNLRHGESLPPLSIPMRDHTFDAPPANARKRLLVMLWNQGLLDEYQIAEALRRQAETGECLRDVLLELGFVVERDIALGISRQFGLPFILASEYHIDPAMADILPVKRMRENGLVLLDRIGIVLIVAVSGIVHEEVLEEIVRREGCGIQLLVTLASEVARCLERFPKSS